MIMRDLLAQSEKNISESILYDDFKLLINVPMDQIKARLVKWSSESRLESAAAIYEKSLSIGI